MLAVAYILANLEKFFHKRIPQVFDFTFTPMLAIITTGLLTFTIVGPFMRLVSDGLTDSLVWLYNTTGAVGLGVFGTFYSAIVITGLHQSFPAIETTLLAEVAKTGGSFIFPIAAMANIAQGAATLAVFVNSKNEKEKSLASSASISALLGITEPAIFGVNLKLKYPFICAMIASGIAYTTYSYFKIDFVNTPNDKYALTYKELTYRLAKNQKTDIYFNSWYKVSYSMNYDNELKNRVRIVVKYNEIFYDLNSQNDEGDIYVSLVNDQRDMISMYINNLKENKIYNEKELSRYLIKIYVNEKDYKKLVIHN